MTDDEPGTGGLTFEPPRTPEGEESTLGFAPDLDEDVPNSALWDAPAEGASTTPGGSTAAAVADARRRRGAGRYPIAEAALDALLGVTKTAPAPDDGAPFPVGPDIMRPPPAIATPAPVREAAPAGPPTRTDELMEDMVDMMLVGDDEDGGQQIHLAFKDDVFGGLYLKLARTPDGLFATFLVPDDGARRAVNGQVDELLSRLRSRGMKIAGHSIEVRDG